MKTVADLLREVPEHKLLERIAELHEDDWQQARPGYVRAIAELKTMAAVPSDLICRAVWGIEQRHDGDGDVTTGSIECTVDGFNAETGEVFGLDFTSWGKWLGMPVKTEPAVAIKHPDLVLAEILWEMTFWGYTAKSIDAQREDLEKTAQGVRDGTIETFPIDRADH